VVVYSCAELFRKSEVGVATVRVDQEEEGICTIIAGGNERKGPAGRVLGRLTAERHAVSTLLIGLR
jgi:hypothetical protein